LLFYEEADINFAFTPRYPSEHFKRKMITYNETWKKICISTMTMLMLKVIRSEV